MSEIIPVDGKCRTCMFWDSFYRNEFGDGECHRYAPREVDRRNYGNAIFPKTGARITCGEYKYYETQKVSQM